METIDKTITILKKDYDKIPSGFEDVYTVKAINEKTLVLEIDNPFIEDGLISHLKSKGIDHDYMTVRIASHPKRVDQMVRHFTFTSARLVNGEWQQWDSKFITKDIKILGEVYRDEFICQSYAEHKATLLAKHGVMALEASNSIKYIFE